MARTLAPAPTDRSMWRKLLRLAHPDGGGAHDLFIWVHALHEHVVGDRVEEPTRHTRREPPPHQTTGDRVDFTSAYEKASSFAHLTGLAVDMSVEEPYASLLRLLSDCYEAAKSDATLFRQQNQGATYTQLAAIAYKAGMTKEERIQWYRVAESVPLSQRHAGHIMGRLQKEAA